MPPHTSEAQAHSGHARQGGKGQRHALGERGDGHDEPAAGEAALDHAEPEEHARPVGRIEPVYAVAAVASHPAGRRALSACGAGVMDRPRPRDPPP